MNKHKTNVMRSIQDSLYLLQDSIIGICNITKTSVECVIDEDEHTFTSIHIVDLLGLQTTVYSKSTNSFSKFPDNQTLLEVLDNPMIFAQWYAMQIPKK
jgi:hypothetical protein